MMSVYEQLLLSLPSDVNQSMTPKQEQLIVFMTTLCDWSIPSRDDAQLLDDLLDSLRDLDEHTNDKGEQVHLG